MHSGSYVGRVADLVDPYNDAQSTTASESLEEVIAWTKAHPGRWAMFADGEQGFSRDALEKSGLEVSQKKHKPTGRTRKYARLPHAAGESLDAALTRGDPRPVEYPTDLPRLESDRFGWTPEELAMATEAARDKLFPVNSRRG
jgi:hypothetical protein